MRACVCLCSAGHHSNGTNEPDWETRLPPTTATGRSSSPQVLGCDQDAFVFALRMYSSLIVQQRTGAGTPGLGDPFSCLPETLGMFLDLA